MAVLVAYYLKEVATGDEKKESISVADIETYFVQGDFPLPKRPVTALTNAKSAGYLESADREDTNSIPSVIILSFMDSLQKGD